MSTQHDHKDFVKDQIKRGKEIFLQANIEGYINAKYGLAIVLLCESNDEGIQLLFSIINQPDGKKKKKSPKLLTNPSIYNFVTNTFHIPKNQACKNIGVDHWDYECPYPYGNKELHVTCKMCSNDLKMRSGASCRERVFNWV